MEQAIQLYGYLILTFLGIVSPILVILLSMFRKGMLQLTTQYENEKSQSEKNIKEQLKKIGEAAKTDMEEIQQSLNKLKAIKKTAETKLSYLNPKKQVLRLYIPFFISFLGVILAILLIKNNIYVELLIAISLTFFVYSIVVLWKLLDIIIEVKKTIDYDYDKKGIDMKTIASLSALVEKETKYFLKSVYIAIDEKNIQDEMGKITVSVDKKQELKIGIHNLETRMAKNLEIGFIFPFDFIIEKTNYYSIYTTKTIQVVRYAANLIHGTTNLILSPLIITPLKEGDYKIKTFIKAENIEFTYHNLNIKVTEKPSAEIFKEMFAQQQKGG